MWKTVKGERKLTGPERELFTAALDLFIDVDKGNDFDTMGDITPTVFARLSIADKYLVLRYVAKALLTDAPAPFLSALLESAVYAVIHYTADRWEMSSPEEVAEELVDLFMQDEGFLSLDILLPDSGCDGKPPRDDVLRALAAYVKKDGVEFIVESLADKILWDRDFELPPMMPGDPRFVLMGIDAEYWSRGPKQLQALRDEARRAGESFSVVYWDLKASYLTTVSARRGARKDGAVDHSAPLQGFSEVWAAVRPTALTLEKDAPEAVVRPKTRKHFDVLSTHVDALVKRAIAAGLAAEKKHGSRVVKECGRRKAEPEPEAAAAAAAHPAARDATSAADTASAVAAPAPSQRAAGTKRARTSAKA